MRFPAAVSRPASPSTTASSSDSAGSPSVDSAPSPDAYRLRSACGSWSPRERSASSTARYELDAGDVGYSADQLFNKIVYDVLMADPKIRTEYGAKISNPAPYEYKFELTAADWDAVKPVLSYCFPGPYKDRLVNDLGFWNLIEDQVSEEGYQFLADAGGY
jgi:hypothetical protein